ncbi:MAG: UDP-4-amino-4,6-dideoxy-N-acetyl-beta-L-altrosamine transaminase, partial [Proteobacteria bacterium]|nr:UDP-4-amino-4,6-dideoxy-N-acetyl-beta-L-altrosamine transaminase [Pseudomonadota bacterium]
AFEEALAGRVGAKHAVACSSGTAALHLAAAALDIGPDDKVIVPSMTFMATANAARYVGAEVVFADVDADSGLMREQDLTAALEKNPDATAVFPVHMRGQRADMNGISLLARERGMKVVEDACHALGTTHTDGIVGDCADSDATVFSFHPVKTIAMGEGGAITTNDADMAARLKRLRSHAIHTKPRDEAPWFHEMAELGFNYRASDIHCALGLSQLGKLDRFLDIRRRLVAVYDEALAGMAPILETTPRTSGENPGWHLYVVLIDFDALGMTRGAFMQQLKDRGIGSQVHYIPVHTQPYYRKRYGDVSLPGAEAYYARCLSLPLFTGMSEGDVERVADTLKLILSPETF